MTKTLLLIAVLLTLGATFAGASTLCTTYVCDSINWANANYFPNPTYWNNGGNSNLTAGTMPASTHGITVGYAVQQSDGSASTQLMGAVNEEYRFNDPSNPFDPVAYWYSASALEQQYLGHFALGEGLIGIRPGSTESDRLQLTFDQGIFGLYLTIADSGTASFSAMLWAYDGLGNLVGTTSVTSNKGATCAAISNQPANSVSMADVLAAPLGTYQCNDAAVLEFLSPGASANIRSVVITASDVGSNYAAFYIGGMQLGVQPVDGGQPPVGSPEPGLIILVGSGLVGLGVARKRFQRSR